MEKLMHRALVLERRTVAGEGDDDANMCTAHAGGPERVDGRASAEGAAGPAGIGDPCDPGGWNPLAKRRRVARKTCSAELGTQVGTCEACCRDAWAGVSLVRDGGPLHEEINCEQIRGE